MKKKPFYFNNITKRAHYIREPYLTDMVISFKKTTDRNMRNVIYSKIYEVFIPMLHHMTKGWYNREEAYSIFNELLYKIILKYDESKGASFKTYSYLAFKNLYALHLKETAYFRHNPHIYPDSLTDNDEMLSDLNLDMDKILDREEIMLLNVIMTKRNISNRSRKQAKLIEKIKKYVFDKHSGD